MRKVAVVTGGGSGIGRATAKNLAEAGFRVVVFGRRNEALAETIRSILEGGGEGLAVRGDVTIARDIDRLVDATVEKFGRIDVLVNSAGISSMAQTIELPERDWDSVMATNAKGVFLTCKRVASQMIKQGGGGKIVNLSSIGGKKGYAFRSHYCASKFAVIGFTQSLALELSKYRINVNAVCPGNVETDMMLKELEWESSLTGKSPDEIKRETVAATPLGRLETPEDVAKVVRFLSSEDSDYMTGQAINVTGGLMMS